MSNSYVVTGGGRGVGRAIAARLAADGGTVPGAGSCWARS